MYPKVAQNTHHFLKIYLLNLQHGKGRKKKTIKINQYNKRAARRSTKKVSGDNWNFFWLAERKLIEAERALKDVD